jgi:hypothetical protein
MRPWTSCGRPPGQTRRVVGRSDLGKSPPFMPATLPPALGWAWRSLAGSTDPGTQGRHRFTAFLTRSTSGSRACGRSASSAATASGEVSWTRPWRATSRAVSGKQASHGFAAASAPRSSLWRSPASAAECAPRVEPSGRPSSRPFSRTRSSSRWAMPSGCSRSPRCCGSTSCTTASFSARSRGPPTKRSRSSWRQRSRKRTFAPGWCR